MRMGSCMLGFRVWRMKSAGLAQLDDIAQDAGGLRCWLSLRHGQGLEGSVLGVLHARVLCVKRQAWRSLDGIADEMQVGLFCCCCVGVSHNHMDLGVRCVTWSVSAGVDCGLRWCMHVYASSPCYVKGLPLKRIWGQGLCCTRAPPVLSVCPCVCCHPAGSAVQADSI